MATQTASADAGAAFSSVVSAALDLAPTKASRSADRWIDKLNDVASGQSSHQGDGTDLVGAGLDEVAEGGGATQQAGVKGLQAGLQGKNPVWAAIKGAWVGGTVMTKAAIVAAVVALILMAVLSPVLLIVFLLSFLVIAAVVKGRSTKQD